MSVSSNPFVVPEKQKPASRVTAVAWAVAVVGVMAALLSYFVWSKEAHIKQRELEAVRAELDMTVTNLAGTLALLQTAVRTNQDVLALLTNQISELQKQKALVDQTAKSLEDEMRHQLESKDVTISKLQGKLTVSIVDRVMFDSGEAILKPDGAAVMQKIADLLASHPGLQIQVVGHTDNVPIRQTAQSRFASNWELSAARALAAVHFLSEKAGVDPRRVGAVGYGEFRPLAENSTMEGRARNRRIEITVLPEDLAIADAMPIPHGQPLTNSPPVTATTVPAD